MTADARKLKKPRIWRGWAAHYPHCANVALTLYRSKRDLMRNGGLEYGDEVIYVEVREVKR